MITIIAVIITIVLCTIAHEWDIRDYRKEAKALKKERDRYIDRYYNLQNKIIGIEKEDDQLSNIPEDYIMD